MNRYEQKQEARRARLADAADRAEGRADAAYSKADMSEEATGIPLGQPILVGHHSEGRHRRAIAKADNAMRKSVAESKRAAELRGKAASVGQGGISSDDPDAINKLKEKLAGLTARHDLDKAVNKALRKKNTEAGNADLQALGFDPDQINVLREPDYMGRLGIPSYVFSNRNAEMKRLEKRIRDLDRADERETREYGFPGFTYIMNADENRLQFVFPGKPDADIRAILKGHGFRWAPSQDAWQRQWTGNGVYAAKAVLSKLATPEEIAVARRAASGEGA